MNIFKAADKGGLVVVYIEKMALNFKRMEALDV